MGLINCKECGKEISDKADSCPNCGFNLKKSKGNKRQALGCLFWIFILFLGFNWVSSWEFADPEPWDQRDNSTMAYIMCEDWVKNRLKSPSTAEFPGIFDGKLDNTFKDGTTYSVTSYVDAQNSFGGTNRIGFTCETTQTSEDNWQLVDLVIDE